MNADQVIEEVKSALIMSATAGVMGVIVSAVPFFGLPVVNQLTKLVVEYVIETAVKFTELGAFFLYVDLYVDKERRDFEEAVAKKQSARTNSEIAAANQAVIEAARKFIKWTA